MQIASWHQADYSDGLVGCLQSFFFPAMKIICGGKKPPQKETY
jgi:hypothetical protein